MKAIIFMILLVSCGKEIKLTGNVLPSSKKESCPTAKKENTSLKKVVAKCVNEKAQILVLKNEVVKLKLEIKKINNFNNCSSKCTSSYKDCYED